MQSARAVYDLEIEFLEYLAPPGLLPDGLRRASKPLKSGVICPYDELPPKQMLPERTSVAHDRE